MRKRFDDKLTTVEKRLQRRIVFETIIPYLSFFPNLRTNIDLTHLRDNERDFGLVEYSASVTFSYPLARRLTLSIGGDVERNNLELFVNQDELDKSLASNTGDALRLRRLLLVPRDDSTLLSARTALNWDQRDSPFIPTRGFLVSLSAELCGTPDTRTLKTESSATRFVSRFVKTTVGTSGYLSAGAGVVFAGLLRVGGIFHLFKISKTYPNRAFFLGGVDIADEIRVKKADADISNDLDPNNVVRSADAFILVRAEMRFPIVGALQGGVFSDLGNLWADPFGHTQASVSVDPFALRPSAGVGIRFNSPVGPFALDYGILLLRRKWLGEPFGNWHLSIGLF
jgi:outer membrane protein insertion porin family